MRICWKYNGFPKTLSQCKNHISIILLKYNIRKNLFQIILWIFFSRTQFFCFWRFWKKALEKYIVGVSIVGEISMGGWLSVNLAKINWAVFYTGNHFLTARTREHSVRRRISAVSTSPSAEWRTISGYSCGKRAGKACQHGANLGMHRRINSDMESFTRPKFRLESCIITAYHFPMSVLRSTAYSGLSSLRTSNSSSYCGCVAKSAGNWAWDSPDFFLFLNRFFLVCFFLLCFLLFSSRLPIPK